MGASGPDTALEGSGGSFPTTIWSQVQAAGDPASPENRQRLEQLVRLYWKPVYVFIRTAWRKPVEDAKDLTQSFFAHLLEKDFLARCRPGRGSFRGYLKQALRFFLTDADRAAAVRRPIAAPFSIEASEAELQRLGPATPDESPERAYDREWFRALMEVAIDALAKSLAAEGKAAYFEAFKACVLDPQGDAPAPTYSEAAARLGLKESDVRNYLAHCRRALREILRERVLEYVGSESEADEELEVFLKG